MTRSVLARILPPETVRRWSHGIQYAALNGIAGLLGFVGVDRASWAMGKIWRLLAPLNSRHARADGHLAAAFPEMGADERRRILGDMWENLGRTAAETVLLDRLIERRGTFEVIVPPEGLEPAHAGCIVVSLHSANWEIAALALADAGLTVHGVYKPLRNPMVEKWLLERRLPVYRGGLVAYDRHIALKLRSIAKSGDVLAVLGDLNDPHGMPVPFFGRPASANPFPAMLARRLGLPIFMGRVVRKDGVDFRLEGRWLPLQRTDDAAADDLANTTAIHAQFEAWIREYPAQWMWAHRKWL